MLVSRLTGWGAFRDGISLYHRHFWLFFAISSSVGLPVALFALAQVYWQDEANFSVPAAVVSLVAGGVGLLGITHTVSQPAEGRAPAFGASFAVICQVFFRWLGATLLALTLTAAILLVAVLCLVFFGRNALEWSALTANPESWTLWLAKKVLVALALPWLVRWSLIAPAVMFEGAGPWLTLRRSAELTRGRRWQICGLFVLGSVPGYSVTGLVALASDSFGGDDSWLIYEVALAHASWILLAPVIYIALTLFYWEAREQGEPSHPAIVAAVPRTAGRLSTVRHGARS